MMGNGVGMYPIFRAPRKAFQAKVWSRGAEFGSSLRASLLRKVAPELASRERVLLCEGGAGTRGSPLCGDEALRGEEGGKTSCRRRSPLAFCLLLTEAPR